MSDYVNKKILLVGAGPMAVDYYKVLEALHCEVTIIGRSESSASIFLQKTGNIIITGGIEQFLRNNIIAFDAVIIAVGMEQLAPTAIQVIKSGVRTVLIEKPAGLNGKEIRELARTATEFNATVLVAYNRRFYSSVLKTQEIIKNDGGVTSFNFEFTEWSHTIEPLDKKPGIKENWLLANSTHVIDLAFYLGGKPAIINCFTSGKLSWHDKAVFTGAGKTLDDVLFSYQANWAAPGRWGVEILTNKSRLILRPLEELQIQLKGSVAINKVELDNTLDIQFKPGLFLQTQQFLNNMFEEFKTVQEQAEMLDIYEQIGKGN